MVLEVGEVGPLFLLLMIDKIKEIIEPILNNEGVELVDVIYRKEAGKQVLRLLVDRDGGIKLSDCVSLNKTINGILDLNKIITEDYVLEVDSPGIGRWFTSKKDYERSKERLVRVTLSESISNKKEYTGRIKEVSVEAIKIDVKKKGIIDIPFDKIVRARQEVEF